MNGAVVQRMAWLDSMNDLNDDRRIEGIIDGLICNIIIE